MTETGRSGREADREYSRLFITQRERLGSLKLSEEEVSGLPTELWYLIAHKLDEEGKNEQHEIITYSATLDDCLSKLVGPTKLDNGDVKLIKRILIGKKFEDNEEQQVLTVIPSKLDQIYIHGIRQGAQEIMLREEAQKHVSLVAVAAPYFGKDHRNSIKLFERVHRQEYSLVVSFRDDKKKIELTEEMKNPRHLAGRYYTLDSCLEAAERKGFPHIDSTRMVLFSELLSGRTDENRPINMIGYCPSREYKESLAIMTNNGRVTTATGRNMYTRLRGLLTNLRKGIEEERIIKSF